MPHVNVKSLNDVSVMEVHGCIAHNIISSGSYVNTYTTMSSTQGITHILRCVSTLTPLVMKLWYNNTVHVCSCLAGIP